MDLSKVLGLGIAGNFAGHLEQAGETPDFVHVKTDSASAPKGIFPFYVPHSTGRLGIYPFSDTQIILPADLGDNAHLQAEPEICVLFAVTYQFGKIVSLQPQAFSAFNDCSIRRPNARKISDKKNWGAHSKGLSQQFIKLNNLDQGGVLDDYRIASFLKRDGTIHTYGIDSAVASYCYFHQQLLDWMKDKFNHQANFGPLENLNQIIHAAGFPRQFLVSLGATQYSEFAQQHFLQAGDEYLQFVYHATDYSASQIQELAKTDVQRLDNASLLRQHIVNPL
ncbi:hypothetical protein THMIRHAS_07960 [Thiosulfatimonas sediminis]|uniref:Uncharacterized protein n=1 Tax=Thiosulfatimonas sediminis TaxID=2675054 RepID=A0A6F8PTG0_9GAMM|nr:DUF5718 family protein [Thiosulfatimonas sediminis]BBP45423.1 hypothetical protein THMIRHAS_07960 [Thiosulfatimonas sediminis]